MYSINEIIVRNSSYEQNESFKKEGHELHQLRITIHRLSVEAAGHEEWNRFHHKCPIKMFDYEIEALISNAVDLGNWAAIELYDPIDNYGGY